MSNVLKIGFSTKDPFIRIQELNTTGLPHPFVVEYDVLVMGPREVEQAVHADLKAKRKHEAKEFFRVSVTSAITSIRSAIKEQGKKIIAEEVYSSSYAVGANQPYRNGQCQVCGADTLAHESRCGNCFALLP